MPLRAPGRILPAEDHLLWLKGMLLWLLTALALLAGWHVGLVQQVLFDDRSGLALTIAALFLLAALHGSFCLFRLSTLLNQVAAVERAVRGGRRAALPWPPGVVSRYVRLMLGADGPALADEGATVQAAFASEIAKGHGLGRFTADLLLSLGLLGTVIGFVAMLGPIATLDGGNHAAIKGALATMSGGMAVALYTTLAGLIGGMWLKLLGFLLEGGVEEVLRRTSWLIEGERRTERPARSAARAVEAAHG
jgi:hypothetical protein